jgi:hypothetical protein
VDPVALAVDGGLGRGAMTVTVPMPVPHPARFSEPILAVIGSLVDDEAKRVGRPIRVLDPFAGVGGCHCLARTDLDQEALIETVGVELEPEWASQHPLTMVGDGTALPFGEAAFDVVATSPTYGNRMADHHIARDGSARITYRHKLGRALTPGNSGAMQWGAEYRFLHVRAWREVARTLTEGGLFILNVSNHIRKGVEMPVVEWHRDTLLALEFTLEWDVEVRTARMGFGANGAKRVGCEHVLVVRSSGVRSRGGGLKPRSWGSENFLVTARRDAAA